MRRKKAVILSCVMLAGSIVTACGQAGSNKAETAAAGETAAAETEAPKEQDQEQGKAQEQEKEAEKAESQETGESDSAARIVLDSEGKEVVIPAKVERVAPSIGAFAQVTEMLSRGKIAAASTAQISEDFKAVFTDYAKSNPDNRDSSSVEDLIAADVQVVYGPAAAYSEEQLEQLAQAGIAYVNISSLSGSEDMMDSYRLIGEILGEEERAEAFCSYWQGSIDDCQERTAQLQEEDRARVLRLSVSGGAYSTVNNTDIFTSIAEEAGAVNVAAEYQPEGGKGAPGGGRNSGLSVDAEQIIAWNPDVIISMNKAGAEEILADPALAGVKAVKEGKVYNTPQGLYLWGVRSGENAMMTPWLGTILYPELFEDVDMEQVVMDFYKDWYQTEIDAETASEILEGK